MDVSRALARVGGDRRLLSELAGLFLTEYPKLLATLDESAARADYVTAADAAHQLKGLLAQFAADEESGLASQAEAACKAGRPGNTIRQLREGFERLHSELKNLTQPGLL